MKLSKKILQPHCVIVHSHFKNRSDAFLIWNLSEVWKRRDIPSVEFSVFNFVIALFIIVKLAKMLYTRIFKAKQIVAFHPIAMLSECDSQEIPFLRLYGHRVLFLPLPCATDSRRLY